MRGTAHILIAANNDLFQVDLFHQDYIKKGFISN